SPRSPRLRGDLFVCLQSLARDGEEGAGGDARKDGADGEAGGIERDALPVLAGVALRGEPVAGAAGPGGLAGDVQQDALGGTRSVEVHQMHVELPLRIEVGAGEQARASREA